MEQLTFLWVLFTLIVIGNSIVLITLSVSKAVIVKCEGRSVMILELHRGESSLKKSLPLKVNSWAKVLAKMLLVLYQLSSSPL